MFVFIRNLWDFPSLFSPGICGIFPCLFSMGISGFSLCFPRIPPPPASMGILLLPHIPTPLNSPWKIPGSCLFIPENVPLFSHTKNSFFSLGAAPCSACRAGNANRKKFPLFPPSAFPAELPEGSLGSNQSLGSRNSNGKEPWDSIGIP